MSELSEYKEKFIDAVRTKDSGIVVQEYLIDGRIYFFQGLPDKEYQFKKDFSDCLKVHIRDIAIVGSAKLGFSLKPDDGRYKLGDFSEDSDVDIAIVSGSLFERQLDRIYKYTNRYGRLTDYFRSMDQVHDFSLYALKGWLRPDMMPVRYRISDAIFEVRNRYMREYNRRVNIGIYKSWYYFEDYHMRNVKRLKVNLGGR